MELRALRKAKKLTQKKLSVLADVSQGKICEYEAGKVLPRVDTAIKLAKALGCTLDELMGSGVSEKAG